MELTSLKVVLNSARMAFGVVSAEMVGMFWMPMLFAAFSNAYLGEGSGFILLLHHVECYGTETRLVDCPTRSYSNCLHSEVAGVRCMILNNKNSGKSISLLVKQKKKSNPT